MLTRATSDSEDIRTQRVGQLYNMENQMDDLMLPEPGYKQKWQTTDGNKWISGVTNYYTEDQMREYAKKAVEADRAKQQTTPEQAEIRYYDGEGKLRFPSD